MIFKVMIVLYWLGLITSGYTAENVYNVLPDDSTCDKDPCLYLGYLIDNHQYYFTSNTRIVFTAESHHIISNNMIIKNISNFLLVSTSEAVITCSPQMFIGFYNVVNLIIKNLHFQECGSSLNYSYDDSAQLLFAGIFFHECINVQISNVYIYDPLGYGIVATNLLGYSTLENITVFMGRQEPYKNSTYQQFTCSYGIQLKYVDSRNIKIEHVFIAVSNIVLSLMTKEKRQCTCALHYYGKFRGMFVMLFKQRYYTVLVTLKDSVFFDLLGNVFVAYSESLANNSISFINCNFTKIRMTDNNSTTFNNFSQPWYVLGFYYTIHSGYDHNFVLFNDCYFSYTESDIGYTKGNNVLVHIVAQLLNINQINNSVLIVRFKNVTFHKNNFTLLEVISDSIALPIFHETPISILIEDNFLVNHNEAEKLIYLHNVQVHFNGTIQFIGNVLSTIIYTDSSKLLFTNTTIFHNNKGCKYLISLNGKWLYISLSDRANITMSNNELENEMISIPIMYNQPFPYCIFQFNCNHQNISINILDNVEKLVDLKRSNSTINKLTSHCKLSQEMELPAVEDPLTVYKQIIETYQHHYPLGIHTNICYCPTFRLSYNCSVDQLGKVYPGQTLTVDLCLPYDKGKSRILYVETDNDFLPQSACKVYNLMEYKHMFNGNQSKKVNFTIASSHPLMCELFLTAQPDLYTYYDTFYIQLLPCPLGFMLQNDVCDCDPLLSPYIEKCSINYQTVKRSTNCWISGNTLNNSTKYYVANNCPIFYCSQAAIVINVQQPDTQCQQHRTGSLCSQCIPGYSLVLGSLECKKCTNNHLAFITVILFNGLLVLTLMFILNFTVTIGTPNALILYLNVIRINDFSRNLESKLIQPLSAYIKICNLGSYFEMCIYNGMDVYTKKWIHFVFPTYLILIAYSLIVASRYSNKIFWLTHTRSLPVLATLFIFTYTNMLETISSVLLFTTITSLPGNHSYTVWYLDPNIPLFGWKFLLLSIVSSILLILLIILNVILLFTKTLMRFRVIHRLKPFIDALQGPFKGQYYYWIGVHLLIRNVMLLICTLGEHLSITIGCIIMMTAAVTQSYLQPYKRKMINFHEMFLFCNYIVLWILLLFDGGELTNVIVLNVLVGISFLQLISVVLYHIYYYVVVHRCPGVQHTARAAWMKIKRSCWCCRQNYCRIHSYRETTELQIPQVSFNLSEFREPLLDVD